LPHKYSTITVESHFTNYSYTRRDSRFKHQWKEKYLNFHKCAVVKVGGGHDFGKIRSNIMYNVFAIKNKNQVYQNGEPFLRCVMI